jgi:hypothetical protein
MSRFPHFLVNRFTDVGFVLRAGRPLFILRKIFGFAMCTIAFSSVPLDTVALTMFD